MSQQAASQPPPDDSFDRFKDFTRRILAVPKSEIDEIAAKEREAKKQKKDAQSK